MGRRSFGVMEMTSSTVEPSPAPINLAYTTFVLVHGANRCTVRMPYAVKQANEETQAIRRVVGEWSTGKLPVYEAVMHATFKRLWRGYGVML